MKGEKDSSLAEETHGTAEKSICLGQTEIHIRKDAIILTANKITLKWLP